MPDHPNPAPTTLAELGRVIGVDVGSLVIAGSDSATFNTQTNDYTLALSDAAKVVGLNKASAVNLTVPANASVAFATGAIVTLRQVGAGQVTVVAAGGVTVNSRGAALKLTGQWAYATLIKTATDTWDLSGDLTL